jgi:hypothetical protein
MLRELTEQPAFAPLCGDELFPGADVQSDAEIDESIRSGSRPIDRSNTASAYPCAVLCSRAMVASPFEQPP